MFTRKGVKIETSVFDISNYSTKDKGRLVKKAGHLGSTCIETYLNSKEDSISPLKIIFPVYIRSAHNKYPSTTIDSFLYKEILGGCVDNMLYPVENKTLNRIETSDPDIRDSDFPKILEGKVVIDETVDRVIRRNPIINKYALSNEVKVKNPRYERTFNDEYYTSRISHIVISESIVSYSELPFILRFADLYRQISVTNSYSNVFSSIFTNNSMGSFLREMQFINIKANIKDERIKADTTLSNWHYFIHDEFGDSFLPDTSYGIMPLVLHSLLADSFKPCKEIQANTFIPVTFIVFLEDFSNVFKNIEFGSSIIMNLPSVNYIYNEGCVFRNYDEKEIKETKFKQQATIKFIPPQYNERVIKYKFDNIESIGGLIERKFNGNSYKVPYNIPVSKIEDIFHFFDSKENTNIWKNSSENTAKSRMYYRIMVDGRVSLSYYQNYLNIYLSMNFSKHLQIRPSIIPLYVTVPYLLKSKLTDKEILTNYTKTEKIQQELKELFNTNYEVIAEELFKVERSLYLTLAYLPKLSERETLTPVKKPKESISFKRIEDTRRKIESFNFDTGFMRNGDKDTYYDDVFNYSYFFGNSHTGINYSILIKYLYYTSQSAEEFSALINNIPSDKDTVLVKLFKTTAIALLKNHRDEYYKLKKDLPLNNGDQQHGISAYRGHLSLSPLTTTVTNFFINQCEPLHKLFIKLQKDPSLFYILGYLLKTMSLLDFAYNNTSNINKMLNKVLGDLDEFNKFNDNRWYDNNGIFDLNREVITTLQTHKIVNVDKFFDTWFEIVVEKYNSSLNS